MLLEIILIIVGLALIVFGADALVDGSSSIARRSGVSEFVIGLTIVGMGTSAPEMVVSWLGAIEGNSDVAIGNILGSNIFNTMLILGLTAILLPIGITKVNRKRDIPLNFIVTALVLLLGLNATLFHFGGTDSLSRVDGIIMLVLFVAYMWMSFKSQDKSAEQADEDEKVRPVWLAILMVLGGLAGLVIGGRLFVDNGTALATRLHVSDKFIAITLLAGGTSLPELATCVVAAAKKKGALALGNIIGSNVFNLLLILGGAAVIHPISFADLNPVDIGVLIASAAALWLSCISPKKKAVGRVDGIFFVLIWLAYMTYLVITL